jgi:hypothetical protein
MKIKRLLGIRIGGRRHFRYDLSNLSVKLLLSAGSKSERNGM